MWTVGNGGSPNRHRRWVDTPTWDSIAPNYPSEVGTALTKLITLPTPPEHGGRLLLWYGEPGTGKTTAIRSLAHEWREWADIHFVLDPEAFFGSPEYLMHVVADEDLWDLRSLSTSRWKVLIVEDADELIRADARVDRRLDGPAAQPDRRDPRPWPAGAAPDHHQRADARPASGGGPTRALSG